VYTLFWIVWRGVKKSLNFRKRDVMGATELERAKFPAVDGRPDGAAVDSKKPGQFGKFYGCLCLREHFYPSSLGIFYPKMAI
jgi:hypothetical protein